MPTTLEEALHYYDTQEPRGKYVLCGRKEPCIEAKGKRRILFQDVHRGAYEVLAGPGN